MIINIVLTKMMLRINLTAGGGGGVDTTPKKKRNKHPKFSVDVRSFLAQILRQV